MSDDRLPLEVRGLELLSDEGLEELRQKIAAEVIRRGIAKASETCTCCGIEAGPCGCSGEDCSVCGLCQEHCTCARVAATCAEIDRA